MKKLTPLSDLDVLTFGPFSGRKLRDVPALYLLSLIDQSDLKKHQRLKLYIERAARQLKAEVEESQKQIDHSEGHLHD